MTGETKPNVFRRLMEARTRFHAAELKKTGFNKFAGYAYFELGDFVAPALRIFADVGLASVTHFGDLYAEMQIINVDEPDDRIVFSTPVAEASLKGCHPIQNLGAQQTYLRRYLWTVALELVEHDAVDAAAPQDAPAKASAEQLADLKAKAEEKQADMPKFLKYLGVASLDDLTVAQFNLAVKALNAKRSAQNA